MSFSSLHRLYSPNEGLKRDVAAYRTRVILVTDEMRIIAIINCVGTKCLTELIKWDAVPGYSCAMSASDYSVELH